MSALAIATPRKSASWLLLLMGWAILVPRLALAQSLTVDRFVLSGGGGTSTNGAFSVTGTIGQPDSGAKLAGGNYSVEGGF